MPASGIHFVWNMWNHLLGRLQQLHTLQLALFVLGLLVVGWVGGLLAKDSGQWLINSFRLAYLNQYNVRTTLTDEGTSYYVSTTDVVKLQRMLESEEGIVSTVSTFIDGLMIVVISRDHPETYKRLKSSDLVRVITTLPLLCH